MSARTLDEARERALDHLGVDERDAEFEVLAEPRNGLFGRMRVEARVRARVRPTRPRPKAETRARRRRASREAGVSTPTSRAQPPRDRRAPPSGDDGQTLEAREVGDDGSKPPKRPRRQVRRGGDTTARGPETGGDQEMEPEMSLADQAEMARDFLDGLVGLFGLEATVSWTELDEDTVEVAVTGEGLGLFVGPRGTTLTSLQELTRTVVQRHSASRTGRIMVDVDGYRQRRRQALERFTRQVAEEVLSSGRPETLEPMSPADRKVVHDTVNTISGVSTRSEGEEPRRSVVVVPDQG